MITIIIVLSPASLRKSFSNSSCSSGDYGLRSRLREGSIHTGESTGGVILLTVGSPPTLVPAGSMVPVL